MPTAAGPISIPLQKLADLVAQSATFQERVYEHAPTEDLARERIHWPHLNDPKLEALRPHAILQSAGLKWEMKAGGDRNHLRPSGSIELILSDNDRDPTSTTDSQTDFENFVGATLAEIVALAGQGDHLSITAVEQLAPATIVRDEKRPGTPAVFWITKFRIDWGPI